MEFEGCMKKGVQNCSGKILSFDNKNTILIGEEIIKKL